MSANSEVHPRDPTPDAIKGLLILLMVYGHVARLGELATVQDEIVSWIYSFHMPIFLMLSGYFFVGGLERSNGLMRTVRRIVIPYLVFETLYLLGLMAAEFVGVSTSNPPVTSLGQAVGTILLYPIGAYWFIYTIAVIQISFLVAMYLLPGASFRPASIFVAPLVLLALAYHFEILRDWAIAYFLIGMALAASGVRLSPAGYVGLVGCVVILVVSNGKPAPFSIVQVAWCLSLTLLLASVAVKLPAVLLSALSWLGRNTLIILLLHALFVVALKPLAPSFLSADPSGLLNSLIVTVAAIGGCIFGAWSMDQVRVSRVLFGVSSIYARFEMLPPARPNDAECRATSPRVGD